MIVDTVRQCSGRLSDVLQAAFSTCDDVDEVGGLAGDFIPNEVGSPVVGADELWTLIDVLTGSASYVGAAPAASASWKHTWLC
jgi:hypothetical protein